MNSGQWFSKQKAKVLTTMRLFKQSNSGFFQIVSVNDERYIMAALYCIRWNFCDGFIFADFVDHNASKKLKPANMWILSVSVCYSMNRLKTVHETIKNTYMAYSILF